MQLEALKIFCDVIRCSSFSKGASENGVSQSTASQAVHSIEERLGVKLIDRSKRPLVPTPPGLKYYQACRDLLDGFFEVERSIRLMQRSDLVEGTVKLVAIYSVGLSHLTQDLEQFHHQCPRAHCRLDCTQPQAVLERVRDGEADLGILSFPRKWNDLTVVPWKSEEMVLATPPDDPLAQLDAVRVSELQGRSFVHFHENLVIRREIDRFLRRHEVEPSVVLEFDNIENIKRAVEVGTGIAILPRPTLIQEVLTKTLSAIPLSDTQFSRPLVIIHRGESTLGLAGKQLLEVLQSESVPANATADYQDRMEESNQLNVVIQETTSRSSPKSA